MVVDKFYYNILEVNENASYADIKKAYRKLALKWHPDKNQGKNKEEAEKKFKEISEAYSILSDKEKRSNYDRFGKNFENNQGFGNARMNVDPDEIFRAFFENDMFFNNQTRSTNFFFNRGSNIHTVNALVTLEEIYNGSLKKYKINAKRYNSRGQMFTKENILEIQLKKGWKDGTKITFNHEGDQLHPQSLPQNIQFIIKIKNHHFFKRANDDLHCMCDITLKDALVGGEIQFRHLDGKIMKKKYNGVIDTNRKIIIQNKGMPNFRTKINGNLVISFNILFPEYLNEEQEKAISNIL